MKRVIGLLGVILIVSSLPAMAQTESMRTEGGQTVCPGVNSRMYNPQTVTTIKGRVECLAKFPQKRIGSNVEIIFRGVVLKTGKGRFPVYLGPQWYLNQQKFQLKEGDNLEVTASQINMGGTVLFIAREVKANGSILPLRDEQGNPLWRKAGREDSKEKESLN